MVIPFLTLYLTKELYFTYGDAGTVMVFFGLGSFVGSFLGGYLTKKIGFYSIIFGSLVFSGIGFIALRYIYSIEGICIGVFIITAIADALRPAVFVAIETYSKPENRTRSITLLRLAINLGYSAGGAIGGVTVLLLGYTGLFWIDGLTCIAAGLTFVFLLKSKDVKKEDVKEVIDEGKSAYTDWIFYLFLLGLLLVFFAFLQLFSALPIFYRDTYSLGEPMIGLLMTINGVIIFLLEMPVVKYLERPKFTTFKLLNWSAFLIALSFLVFNFISWVGVLYISILLISFGEMVFLPFANKFAYERAERGKTSDYMGLFTMAFALAHIFGHRTGLVLAENYDFTTTWYIIGSLPIVGILIFLWVKHLVKQEKLRKPKPTVHKKKVPDQEVDPIIID